MTDQEIMMLPDWNEALDELIDEFRRKYRREPTEEEIKDLIEILLNRYRELGYLIRPIQGNKKDIGYGMGM